MISSLAAIACALLASFPGLDLLGGDDSRYTVEREFVSPVSGVHFVAQVINTEPGVLSRDYDRCPHAAINVLNYDLVIDPVTGYVEAPERFGLPAPFSKEDVTRILGTPRFNRSTPEGWPWAGAYAWEKYENAALLTAEAGQSSAEVGNYYLLAAWSVRLDFALGPEEFRAPVESLLRAMPPEVPGGGGLYNIYELQLADYWAGLDASGELVSRNAADTALAIAWLYRSRGELYAASYWMALALERDAALADQEGGVYNHLASSINLERDYLKSARDKLKEAWDEGGVRVASEGGVAFLIAECERRLGQFAAAAEWYGQAREHQRGAVSLELIERQHNLVVQGKGY